MIDVDQVVVAHQGPAVIALHGHQLLRLAGRGPRPGGLSQDLAAIGGPLGALAVHQHATTVVVGKRQLPVGQQGGHAKLGIAGQQRQGRFQFRAVTVLLADEAQQFIADLIAQGVGDDHAHLGVLAQEGPDPVVKKRPLVAHGAGLPGGGDIH